MAALKVSHVLGMYLLIFVLFAILVMFIPTIVRSPTLQIILFLIFVGGCTAYFFIVQWSKRKVETPV